MPVNTSPATQARLISNRAPVPYEQDRRDAQFAKRAAAAHQTTLRHGTPIYVRGNGRVVARRP